MVPPPRQTKSSSDGHVFQHGQQVDKYQVRKFLARGSMGEVWQAYDLEGRVDVVIKVLPKELTLSEAAKQRALRSFQQVRNLQHQHLCPVFDLREHPKVGPYLVMKLVNGVDLACYRKKYVEREGTFPFQETMRLVYPVARALDYAHSRRVVHRDVKPENIMIAPDGSDVQVIDFGLAAEIRSTLQQNTSVERDISGTLPYMSPEQWEGKLAKGQSDQYSLAVVVFELLAGHLPYHNDSAQVLRQSVLRSKMPKLRGYGSHVNAVLAKALAKQPDSRFPSCKEFIKAMNNAYQLDVKDKTPRSRVPLLVAMATLVIALCGGLYGGFLLGQTNQKAESSKTTKEKTASTESVRREIQFLTERLKNANAMLVAMVGAAANDSNVKKYIELRERVRVLESRLNEILKHALKQDDKSISPKTGEKLFEIREQIDKTLTQVRTSYDTAKIQGPELRRLLTTIDSLEKEVREGALRDARKKFIVSAKRVTENIKKLHGLDKRWNSQVESLYQNDAGRKIATSNERVEQFLERYKRSKQAFPVGPKASEFSNRLQPILARYQEENTKIWSPMKTDQQTLKTIDEEVRRAIIDAETKIKDVLVLVNESTKIATVTLREKIGQMEHKWLEEERLKIAAAKKVTRDRVIKAKAEVERVLEGDPILVYLPAFTDPGRWQPISKINSNDLEKRPMSYSELKTSGVLDGNIVDFLRVGCHPGSKRKGRWRFLYYDNTLQSNKLANYNISDQQLKEVQKVQSFLRNYGDILVKKKLLSK